ncbi:MAG: glycosyltransferase [Candidatus Aureabacteria bacterium]|nr:glycosyltransferase [Candidatus Auribacterota bacterium]
MPRIAYLIADAPICGGVAVVCQHANRLARRGFDTCILSTAGEERIDWFPGQRVPVYPLSRIPDDIDIGIATWWGTTHHLYTMNIPRKFYFVQSDETRFYPPDAYQHSFARDSYWFPFEYITEARWIQKWLKATFGVKAHYVPNGIDLEIFHPGEPLAPKGAKPRVLIEGPADTPRKGVAECFRALEGLPCEIWYVSSQGVPDPSWRFDRYFSGVPMMEMKRIYSSCDILLKMSTVEGSFGPPLEMMACGGTCVVGRVTGLDEAILPGENALVVEPGDVNGAGQAVKRLIEDGELRQRLIRNGMATATRLDWEKSIDVLEKIFLSPAPAAMTRDITAVERRVKEKEKALIESYARIEKFVNLLRESEQGRQKDIDFLRSEIGRRDKDIECLTNRIECLTNKIECLTNEIKCLTNGIRKRDSDIVALQHRINLLRDELNNIRLSRQWKLAEAIMEARRSPRALLALPLRMIRSILWR